MEPSEEVAQKVREEQENKEKADQDAANAAAGNVVPPPPPRLVSEEGFLRYINMVEERNRAQTEAQNKFFQEVLGRNQDRGREGPMQGVSLSDFQQDRPLTFSTAVEPMEAEDWLLDTERKLNTVGCSGDEKLRYATHLLTGPAASWWENVQLVQPTGRIIQWEEFKQKFREAHVPTSVMEMKKREFETLIQGNYSVLKYVGEFNRLARHAPDEVNTEEKQRKRFLRGLQPAMKIQLSLLNITEFQDLVNRAITLEGLRGELVEDKRKRARLEPHKFAIQRPPHNLVFKPKFRPAPGPPQYRAPGPNYF